MGASTSCTDWCPGTALFYKKQQLVTEEFFDQEIYVHGKIMVLCKIGKTKITILVFSGDLN